MENEELIGTLIETNDRIITALEMYDQLSAPKAESEADVTAVTSGLAATHINSSVTELDKLQDKQRAAVARAKNSYRGKAPAAEDDSLHPDLHDLNFGALGSSSNNLPAPLRPSALSDDGDEPNDAYDVRGSLSDFSDYDSSDEETHGAGPSKSQRDYVTVSDDEAGGYKGTKVGSPVAQGKRVVDDPFADPFAG